MKRIIRIGGALLILAAALIIFIKAKPAAPSYDRVSFLDVPDGSGDYSDDVMIPAGFYINNTPLSGRTKAAARAFLQTYFSEPDNQDVVIRWRGQRCETTLTELGVSWDMDAVLDQCITLAYAGGMLQRYINAMDLKYGTLQMELARSLDIDSTERFVQHIAAVYDIEPVDAVLTRDETTGEFLVQPQENGYYTGINGTVSAIAAAFDDLDSNETLYAEAVIREVEPVYTTAMLEAVGDLLGEYTTVYREPMEEWRERCTNVEVAAAYINGTILMPGQQASASDLMKDRCVENGYAMGSMYVDGEVEDSVGGGVCQVATTLYNALLRAELQIDRRQNHSMMVSYVNPSEDAAIATGSKDLVFTNNQDYPIYIEGSTDGFRITFRIYGAEVRDPGRRIEFVSVEESREVSVDIIEEDPELPAGETLYEGSAHDRIASHLEKVVYENGREVSREILHSDSYSPSQRTVYVGTGAPAPAESAGDTAAAAGTAAKEVEE